MAVENLVDAYYTLNVSTEGATFTKVKHLISCEPPPSEKKLDDVTTTDDKRTVKAVVDFTEDSEIDFEYALNQEDPTHLAIQAAYDANTELEWQFKFVNAPTLSRQFKGIVSKLTPQTDDTKKKIRMMSTITITSEPTATITP